MHKRSVLELVSSPQARQPNIVDLNSIVDNVVPLFFMWEKFIYYQTFRTLFLVEALRFAMLLKKWYFCWIGKWLPF